MRESPDKIIMDDGTTYSCFMNIIGLLDGEILTYGHDGTIERELTSDDIDNEKSPDLPIEHQKEIAEYMIKVWTDFKNKP